MTEEKREIVVEIRQKESEPMTVNKYITITKKNKVKEIIVSSN